MATEINIQESVYLKKVESEVNALTSDSFEEKVTELLGNKVKQLETSSQVAETVNTPLETGKPTAESGTFFQALSVPVVIADENSNIPESCKAAKQTEPKEETIEIEEKAIENEVQESEKVEYEDGSKVFGSMAPVKKEALEKNQGDIDGVTSSQDAAYEDIKEKLTEHDVTTVADMIKEQDLNETPKNIVNEEPEDKSVDAQEASEQCETGSKDIEEQKSEENINKIEQDEEIRPVKVEIGNASVGLNEKAIPILNKDEDEEKEQGVNVLEKDQEKDDTASAQEVTFEEGSKEKNGHIEDNEHEVATSKGSIEDDTDGYVSTQPTPVKESIKNEPGDEKAIEKEVCDEINDPEKAELEGGIEDSDSVAPSQKETVNVIEKDQGDSDGVTSSQEAPRVDVEETTTVQHVTTVTDFKEPDLNEKPRDFIEEETEDKSLDAQEASKECEKGAKEDIEQNPEESVKTTEKEEEIKPGVEIEEKKEQNEFLPAITTDTCISTQTKSQVEKSEQEEDTQNDDGQKEKSDSPSIKEVCEETGLEKTEYEEIATVNKGENGDEEKGQEVNVLEKDGEDDVTSAQDVAFEKDLQEKNHHNEDKESVVVTTEESIEEDTEVIRSSEKTESSDVCISTQTEPGETTEKNDKEAGESDDGQTNESGTPTVKETCEENVPQKTEAEEGLKLSDSSSTALNENETVREDEEQIKEQEIYVSEEGQGGRDDVTSSENASNKDIKETTIGQHDTKVAYFEDKSVDAQEETEQYDDPANDEREQKQEKTVDETANSCSKNEQEVYTKEIKAGAETIEEKDVRISTQIESQEEATRNEENATESDGDKVKTTEYKVKATESEENNDDKTIKNDDVQTEKPENPLIEGVCEAASSEMAESEEEVKHIDSFSTTLNENETLSKEENLEKEDEIKTSEIQCGGDDITSPQNASNEDIKETTIGQHDTTVAYVEEQGVTAVPKEILIEVEDKSIDAEEISLEIGQPNEQNTEETRPFEAISENPEDENKKADKDLSQSVKDTNDNNTEVENPTLEQEPNEEHNDRDEASKEKVTDLNDTTEVEPQEDITPFTLLETSTEDASHSEKEKAESGNLPIEDLETVSEVHIPELVPKSEEPVLKEDCFISETEKHLEEEKEIISKEISSDEKASSENIQETTIGQHVTTVAYVEDEHGVSATSKEIVTEEAEDKSIDAKEISLELGQNVEETHPYVSEIIIANPKDEIDKENKDLSHESVEDTNDDTIKEEKCTLEQEPVEEHNDRDEVSKEKVIDLNETTEVEPQEDIIPSTSLGNSTDNASNSENEKTESENLPTEDLETISEVQIPALVPKSEETVLKKECFISETEKHLDEEKEIASKEISSDEKTEVQGGGDDVTSSQNASSEDIQEKTIGQHVTTAAYVQDGQGVSATPKEILKEEAEDKSIDAKEISLELGQNVEETHPYVSEIISANPEDEINKENKDLSHESVEDTNDDTIKEEKCTLEQEPVEEHNDQDEVSKEKVIDLNETTEVEPQENIIPSTSLGNSTDSASNSEKEKTESENLSTEDLETISEVEIPELVPKSEETVLKEECFISETEKHLEDEKEIASKEISSDEKTEVQGGGDDVTSSQNASSEDIQEKTIGQHVTTAAYVQDGQGVSATPKEIPKEEAEDKSIDAKEISLELGQPNEQNVVEIQPYLSEIVSGNTEDEIKKEDKDLSHESVEDTNDDTIKEEKCRLEQEPVEEHSGRDDVSEKVTNLNETTDVEPQEDIIPSTSLETSTENTSNSEKEKAGSENLPIEDTETVSEVQIPDSSKSEEYFTSEMETHLDEEKETITKEISSDKETEQTNEIKHGTVKKVSEETSSEKTELEEGSKLSDSSNIKINEKEITILKDDEEKDREVNMSAESQGEDIITSSQNEVYEEKEDLKEKSYHNEGNEGDFVKSGEGVNEDTEEIKSSVETKEITEHVITTNVCSSTQRETGEETIESEEKNCDKAIEYDENETVSGEENLEKTRDIEETKMGEHASIVTYIEEEPNLATVAKDVQDKEEGDKSFVVQKETEQYDDGEKDEREQKPEEQTDEIKPDKEKDVCIETQIESQEGATKNEENAIESDGDQKEKLDNPFVKDVCEENDLKKTESEDERPLSDISNVKTIVNAHKDTEEAQASAETKENIEQQGLSHVVTTDVCSSTQTEYVEKTTIEKDYDQTEKPESPVVEVVCEATSSETTESEGLKHPDSFSMTVNENEILGKDEKLEKEDKITTSEVQGGGDDITSSQNASNEDIKETTIGQHDTTVAYVEEEQGVTAVPKEILTEAEGKSIDAEEISLELGQPNEQNVDETRPCPSEIRSENQEDAIKKEDKDFSLESTEDTNDNNTKEEKCTLEQEPVEEHSGRDEVSKEKVSDLNETTEVEPQEDITPSPSLETSTEDTLNLEKERAESENLPTEDLETIPEVQIPELVPKSEDSELKEECFISETETHINEEKGTITEEISSDEKIEQTTEIKQEIVKEECDETRSEKAEFQEELDLSKEKGITGFKDEDQEKDQEVNMSAESQCEDNITSSQKDASEIKEALQENTESDFIKSTEGEDEDTEEVKSGVETKENTEHVITTDVCSSTQTEPVEKTTENEEKNGEKAIENDENEIVNNEENQENKQEDVCSSAQTEPKEETIYNEDTNEEAIENDDGQKNLENQEREQELEISELKGGGDDVISSQNASNEDIKETAIEEVLGMNAVTKEIIKEEVEDKSIHAQEASEQIENGAKDKIEQQPEETVDKPVNSCSETVEGSVKEEADAENKEIESELEAEKQVDRTEDISDIKDEVVLTEKATKELGQPKEQNVEEIQACLTETISEKTNDKSTEKDENLSHDSIEHINENITDEEKCIPDVITKEIEISTLEHEPVGEQNDSQDEVLKETLTDLSETTAEEPQENGTPSASLGTSTEDASKSDKAKAESENLLLEDLESVSKVHIPEVISISEDSKMKEDDLISATATHVDEENVTVTREISSDENLATHGLTQPENSCNTIEESVTQMEQTGEINSLYENRDIEEDVTQKIQLYSTEDYNEMEKDVILTEEIEQVPLEIEKEKGISDFKEQTVEEDSYFPEPEGKAAQNQNEIVHEISNSDTIPVENPEVTETNVHDQIGQEDNSCELKVINDRVDQEAKEERIPSLEDAATVESQVNLSNLESTTYPSETEKLATQALESDCDVQIPEVVADSEDKKVKEECIVLETAEYSNENNVEEQDTKTNEISSAPDEEQENVTEAPAKNDEAKSSDLIIEEKAVIKENLEIHELEPTSEPAMEEDQVTTETTPQPESDIKCENITNDQTLESMLEHTSGKDLEDGKGDKEEDATLAPENEIISTESQNKTTKNIILTDEVGVETEKGKERSEIEGQVSEEDICPTELDNTSTTTKQKELANEIEYSKPIPVGDTEVTGVKAESQIVENIQAAEDLSCSSRASPIIETSKVEMHEDTEQTTTIIEEVKDDSIDEASKDRIIPVLEDSKASGLQVDLPEIESTDTPLNGQDSMKLSEDISCKTPETIEKQGVLTSQLTDREILEDKDVEGISELHTFSEDQRSIKEETQGNFGVEIKDAKSENEAVEDVIVNEVLPEDEKAKESKGIKDIINEEAKVNQLTSDTYEVCQADGSSSRPDELLEAKDSVEDTEDTKFVADNLNVKDETFTVVKEPNEDSETIASEFERLEKTVTEENIIKPDADKEKVTLGEPQADDSAKATYNSIMSSTEQDVVARSEESRDDDIVKLEEKPTEVSESTTEVAEIVPECREASATDVKNRELGELVHRGSQEASEDNTLLSQNDKNTENLEVLPSVEKDAIEGVDKSFEEALVIDVQKHEKDLDDENKDKIVDVVSNVECSETEPSHPDTKEATWEFINQENQREQKKEANESLEAVIPVEDVKTSTREIEVGMVDLKVPSVIDATAQKANYKTVEVHEAGKEEGSGMKQESLELDAPETFGIATTEDPNISQKSVTDDLIKISQTHPEVQKDEVPVYNVDKQSPNEPRQKESTKSNISTEKIDSSLSHEQQEPIAKSLIPEAANLKASEASSTESQRSNTVFIDQKEKSESVEPVKFKMTDMLQEPAKGNSEVAEKLIEERDSALTKDQQVEKEEIGESGVKTDEEGEEEEDDDNEDDEKIGSCSDAPVMVEASKDMEVKTPKKSHNILSGVGSKVKHSIAKVKKAITGKSSPPKTKNQVVG